MFTNLNNLASGQRTTILVYGKSKVGKTSLVKTLKPLNEILICNFENGLLPLKGLDCHVYDCTRNESGPLNRSARFNKFLGLIELLKTEERMKKMKWLSLIHI